MKRNILSAVIAATVAGQALALAPTETPDLTVNISGATAVDKQVEAYIDFVCEDGTLDRYTNPADTTSTFFCNVKGGAETGLAADRKVRFNKASGGSSQGVAPLSYDRGGDDDAQAKIPTLDLTTCAEDLPDNPGNWSCSNTTIPEYAEVGISDVEPELFSIPDNGSKFVDTSDMTVQPVNAQTFGIVVSPGLRDALQAAQGLMVGSDEVSEMPSLSSNVIANIFAGNIPTWDQLKNGAGQGLAEAAGDVAPEVNVCVRTPGSGTQAQFNAYYMKNACAYRGASNGEFVGFETADDTDGVNNNHDIPGGLFGRPAAPWIYENQGSSDLGKCITNINNREDAQNGYSKAWAIGIQSLEKVDEGRVGRNDYKFLAIDGVAPLLENVAAGLYQNWASASIQWRNSYVTGDDLILAQLLVDTAQNKDDVRDFNLSLQDDDPDNSKDDRPAGGFRTPEILNGGLPADVGSLAFAGKAGNVAAAPFVPANPVMPANKGFVGPSSCGVATVVDVIDVSVK